jgi:4-carboxymuconolactone decarboxylase
MTDSPLRAKGRAMRRNLMGAAYADKLDRQLYTDPIMEKFAALTQESIFGSLWTRPELDLKTRTLICVVSDTATGRAPELKLHLRFALNHGWTCSAMSARPWCARHCWSRRRPLRRCGPRLRSRHNSELCATSGETCSAGVISSLQGGSGEAVTHLFCHHGTWKR